MTWFIELMMDNKTPFASLMAVFPGQGSQYVGMGRDVYQQFPRVHRVYEEISDGVGFDVRQAAFEGPEDWLQRTQYAQAALCATSVALLTVLEEEFGILPSFWAQVAGHSMGEYLALYAARVLTLSQTIGCIMHRGRAMSLVDNGGMLAVLGLDMDGVTSVLEQGQQQGLWAVMANDNHPTQKVVSTTSDAMETWQALFKKGGALKCIPLKVAGPFHSQRMQPAQDVFWDFMDQQVLGDPLIPVVSNVTASPLTDALSVKKALRLHMTHPVRWTESIQQCLQAGIGGVVEIGAGKVLSGLCKKILPHLTVYSLDDMATLMEWEGWQAVGKAG